MTDDRPGTLTVVAIAALTVVVLAAIAAMTVVAVLTDRDLRVAEGLTAGAVLAIAVLGGLVVHRVGDLARHDGDR